MWKIPIFPHAGKEHKRQPPVCSLQVFGFYVHVPHLLSYRLAGKVQRAATENKSQGSSFLAKQRGRLREGWHVEELEGGN